MPSKLKTKVRCIPAEEYLSPGAFYAALTLVLAALCTLVAGLGFLGMIDYPSVPVITSRFHLYCTTFGGGLATVLATSSLIFSKKANKHLKTRQMLNLTLRKSCTITHGNASIQVLTKTFQKRFDLLPTLSKNQKLECLQAGQWTVHKEEKHLMILAKFSYENPLGIKKLCSVSLKTSPLNRQKRTKNIVYDPVSEKLFLIREEKLLPFQGDLAINYLMQKMWVFCQQNFKELS